MEYKDCIGNTEPSDLFSPDFLANPLFELLPEGYDICYEAIHQYDMIMIHFYLYDSTCLLYTSPSPRDRTRSRMPSSA